VLTDSLRQAPMRVCACCVMPNHWHLLLWPVEVPQDWVERGRPYGTGRPSGRRRSPSVWGWNRVTAPRAVHRRRGVAHHWPSRDVNGR